MANYGHGSEKAMSTWTAESEQQVVRDLDAETIYSPQARVTIRVLLAELRRLRGEVARRMAQA